MKIDQATSQMLKELGVPMTWVDSHDTEIIVKTMDPSAVYEA